MQKPIKVHIDFWHIDIYVFINCEEHVPIEWVFQKSKHFLVPSNGDACCGKVEDEKGSYFFIWIHEYNHHIYEMGLLAHEIMHCAFRFLGDLGFRLKEGSEEAYTYFTQEVFINFTQEVFIKIMRAIKKELEKPKKKTKRSKK